MRFSGLSFTATLKLQKPVKLTTPDRFKLTLTNNTKSSTEFGIGYFNVIKI